MGRMTTPFNGFVVSVVEFLIVESMVHLNEYLRLSKSEDSVLGRGLFRQGCHVALVGKKNLCRKVRGPIRY